MQDITNDKKTWELLKHVSKTFKQKHKIERWGQMSYTWLEF